MSPPADSAAVCSLSATLAPAPRSGLRSMRTSWPSLPRSSARSRPMWTPGAVDPCGSAMACRGVSCRPCAGSGCPPGWMARTATSTALDGPSTPMDRRPVRCALSCRGRLMRVPPRDPARCSPCRSARCGARVGGDPLGTLGYGSGGLDLHAVVRPDGIRLVGAEDRGPVPALRRRCTPVADAVGGAPC